MNQIAVIGINSFGIKIAAELSSHGFEVTLFNMKPQELAFPFKQTATSFEMKELSSLNIEGFGRFIIVMNGNMELSLKTLILLQAVKARDVLICTENEDHEQVAELFAPANNWFTLRMDCEIGSSVLDLVMDSNKQSDV